MSGKVFVDTNVVLYAYDVDAGEKNAIAQRLLTTLWEERTGVVSAQVLQEFYVNVTRKLAQPLPKKSARAIVEHYSAWCLESSQADIVTAFRLEDEARIGFWDAMIVAAAFRAGAETIVSEDLHHGQKIAGIRVVNPFV